MTSYEERRIEMLELVADRPGLRRADLIFRCSPPVDPFEVDMAIRYQRASAAYRRALKWLEDNGFVKDRSFPRFRISNRFAEFYVTDSGRKFLKDHHD